MVFATNKTGRHDITEMFFENGVKHNQANKQAIKDNIMYGYIMDYIWTLWIREATSARRLLVPDVIKCSVVHAAAIHMV